MSETPIHPNEVSAAMVLATIGFDLAGQEHGHVERIDIRRATDTTYVYRIHLVGVEDYDSGVTTVEPDKPLSSRPRSLKRDPMGEAKP